MNNHRNEKKHQGLKMEDIKLSTCYAVTLSPPDNRGLVSRRIWNIQTPTKILEENIDKHVQIFKSLKYCELELNPELSPKGRLHYHGVIIIKDVLNFYYHDLHILNETMSYEIDTLSEDAEGLLKYTSYCVKQRPIFEAYAKATGTKLPISINREESENIQHD